MMTRHLCAPTVAYCNDTLTGKKEKLHYREEHSASVVLSWCTLRHFSGKICW